MRNPLPKSPGNEPGDPLDRIDERLDRVERDMAEVKGDMAVLKHDVADIKGDIAEMKGAILKLVDVMGKTREDIERIDGRLIEISARLPTIWTIATLIFAIFGASFILIRFAVP